MNLRHKRFLSKETAHYNALKKLRKKEKYNAVAFHQSIKVQLKYLNHYPKVDLSKKILKKAKDEIATI